MNDDIEIRERLAVGFTREFPESRLVTENGDIYVIFVMVDYEPGCDPKCRKIWFYRNWSCEVTTWIPAETQGYRSLAMMFNIDGSTRNPWFDPTESCIREVHKYVQR